jgi:hypothetical protein
LLKHVHNVHEPKDRRTNPEKLKPSDGDTGNDTARAAKKRKRNYDELESFGREELLERLLEEQSKNQRLLEEMEEQRKKLEEEFKVQLERYERNEDRLWRMIEEKR